MRNAASWCNAIGIPRHTNQEAPTLNRRNLLTRSALGLGALGLAGLLQDDGRVVAAKLHQAVR